MHESILHVADIVRQLIKHDGDSIVAVEMNDRWRHEVILHLDFQCAKIGVENLRVGVHLLSIQMGYAQESCDDADGEEALHSVSLIKL